MSWPDSVDGSVAPGAADAIDDYDAYIDAGVFAQAMPDPLRGAIRVERQLQGTIGFNVRPVNFRHWQAPTEPMLDDNNPRTNAKHLARISKY